jgi:hypothetical protein
VNALLGVVNGIWRIVKLLWWRIGETRMTCARRAGAARVALHIRTVALQ